MIDEDRKPTPATDAPEDAVTSDLPAGDEAASADDIAAMLGKPAAEDEEAASADDIASMLGKPAAEDEEAASADDIAAMLGKPAAEDEDEAASADDIAAMLGMPAAEDEDEADSADDIASMLGKPAAEDEEAASAEDEEAASADDIAAMLGKPAEDEEAASADDIASMLRKPAEDEEAASADDIASMLGKPAAEDEDEAASADDIAAMLGKPAAEDEEAASADDIAALLGKSTTETSVVEHVAFATEGAVPVAEAEARVGERADTADPTVLEPPARVPSTPLQVVRADDASEPPDLWDRAAAWTMARGALPALGLVTLGMILIYRHVFHGEVAGDDLTFHMAESARLADCLRAGDFDFWNPSANAGFASAYYYQAVPQLVSAIPAAIFGHHVFFFQLSVFLPLVLAPAAAYRGLRLMGASPWQATIAALALGLANGESRWGAGNAGTFVVGLYTQTWALAAFPLALGHAVRWATQGRGLASAVAWGAFVTLCHPFAGVSLAVALIAGVVANLALVGIDAGLAALASAISPDPGRSTFSAALAALADRWRTPPERRWLQELLRLALLGACLAVVWAPIWLPLLVDYAGFGGFPHRVSDEIGPGFGALFKWYAFGALLDFSRPVVLTWTLPAVLLFARSRYFRWLWAPALIYALWLGMGPHLGKTDDDLVPAVRFLGAMQVLLALGIGAGFVGLARQLWDAPEGSLVSRLGRVLLIASGVIGMIVLGVAIAIAPANQKTLVYLADIAGGSFSIDTLRIILIVLLAAATVVVAYLLWLGLRSQYGVRTALAAVAAALLVLMTLQGARALAARVNTLPDYPDSHAADLHTVTWLLRGQPPGRKQVGSGAENHWWNLLSYEYGRRPSLLMMGGGGLQASPNYDFLWTVKDFKKTAWVYDAPILVYQRSKASSMPSGLKLFETKNYAAMRLPSPGLVSPVQVTGVLPPGRKPAHAAALDWFKTDQPLKDRVLAYAGSGGPGREPHATVTRAIRQDSPGDAPDILADVDAAESTTVMARESWHPRWQAFIDGVPAPIRRVTPDFPAVDVPPGHHTVSFRFDRPWWLHASWLLWPLVPLAIWLVTRRRRAAALAL